MNLVDSQWHQIGGGPLIRWKVGMLLRDLNKLEKWAVRCLTEVQQSSSDVFQMHGEQPMQLNKLEAPPGPVGGIRSLNVSQQCALVVGGPGACWALLARVQPAAWGKWFLLSAGHCETRQGVFAAPWCMKDTGPWRATKVIRGLERLMHGGMLREIALGRKSCLEIWYLSAFFCSWMWV